VEPINCWRKSSLALPRSGGQSHRFHGHRRWGRLGLALRRAKLATSTASCSSMANSDFLIRTIVRGLPQRLRHAHLRSLEAGRYDLAVAVGHDSGRIHRFIMEGGQESLRAVQSRAPGSSCSPQARAQAGILRSAFISTLDADNPRSTIDMRTKHRFTPVLRGEAVRAARRSRRSTFCPRQGEARTIDNRGATHIVDVYQPRHLQNVGSGRRLDTGSL